MISAIEVAALKTNKVLALFDDEDITLLEYATDLKVLKTKKCPFFLLETNLGIMMFISEFLFQWLCNHFNYSKLIFFHHFTELLEKVVWPRD